MPTTLGRQQLRRLFHALLNERQRNACYSVAYRLRGLCYRGSGRYCVCCGNHFRTFLPYGNQPRAQAACPHCNSLERTRLLTYYLQRETPLFREQARVLHFAPEARLAAKLAKQHGSHYVSADINPHLGRHVVDIQQIPYADGHFGWIICAHVLGHVPDEALALQELHRVLAPAAPRCYSPYKTATTPTPTKTPPSPPQQGAWQHTANPTCCGYTG